MTLFAAIGILFAASVQPAASDEMPRDPFWPQGYEGVRHPITLEPRNPPKPKEDSRAKPANRKKPLHSASAAKAKADAAARARTAAERAAEAKLWQDASLGLRFGGTMAFSSEPGAKPVKVVSINGHTYKAGDLVSCNTASERFTWKIESIAPDDKISLRRVRHVPLTAEQKNPTETKR